MSSSLMPCAMMDICSCLRSPALNAFSWRIRYSTLGRQVRRVRDLGDAVEAMADGAGALRHLFAGGGVGGEGGGRPKTAAMSAADAASDFIDSVPRERSGRGFHRGPRQITGCTKCDRPRRRSRRRPGASRRAVARCRPGGRYIRRRRSASRRRTLPVRPRRCRHRSAA